MKDISVGMSAKYSLEDMLKRAKRKEARLRKRANKVHEEVAVIERILEIHEDYGLDDPVTKDEFESLSKDLIRVRNLSVGYAELMHQAQMILRSVHPSLGRIGVDETTRAEAIRQVVDLLNTDKKD